jgi:hypothetical protein
MNGIAPAGFVSAALLSVRNTGTLPARCSFLSRGGLVRAELGDSAS